MFAAWTYSVASFDWAASVAVAALHRGGNHVRHRAGYGILRSHRPGGGRRGAERIRLDRMAWETGANGMV